MKVAQYPPRRTGFAFQRAFCPGLSAIVRTTKEERDDRWLLTLVKLHTRDREMNVSIGPDGTDISSCIISQHFVLGYFHWVLPGRLPYARPTFSN